MSSSKSVVTMTGAGLRVASTTYTPAHSKNGTNISAKLTVYAYQNDGKKGSNNADKPPMQFTIWGKLADICAKALSKGKEFHCSAKMAPYRKRVFFKSAIAGQAGAPVVNSDGSPVEVPTVGFTVRDLSFGADGKNLINEEILAGVRLPGWDVDGSQEQAQFKAVQQARMAVQFDPNSPTGMYGWARIYLPNGPGIGAYTPQAQNAGVPGNAAGIVASLAAVNPATIAPAAAPVAAPVAAAAPVQNGGFVTPGV